jgi:hypothetical protein
MKIIKRVQRFFAAIHKALQEQAKNCPNDTRWTGRHSGR